MMTALAFNGFDDQRDADEINPDGNNATLCAVESGGRSGGYWLMVNTSQSDFAGHRRRGYLPEFSEAGTALWAGGWCVATSPGTVLRLLAVYIDGVAVFALGTDGGTGTKDLYVWWSPDVTVPPTDTPDETVAGVVVAAGCSIIAEVERGVSDGTLRVYIDGTQVAEFTGQAALAEAGSFDAALFTGLRESTGSYQASHEVFWDDCWVGTRNFGDARIPTLLPTAQGFHEDGTPSAGTDNFALVNDAPPDPATYVTLGGDGDRDSYTYDGSGLSAEGLLGVAAVRVQHRAIGAGTLAPFIRESATDHDGTAQAVPGGAVGQVDTIWNDNPATSAEWTFADLNAPEVGARFNV